MVTVRPATQDDLAAMERIRAVALRDRGAALTMVPRASLDDVLADGQPRVAVAELDGTIAGWGAAYLRDSPVVVVYLGTTTDPGTVRRGIIEDLEAVAADYGIDSLPVVIL